MSVADPTMQVQTVTRRLQITDKTCIACGGHYLGPPQRLYCSIDCRNRTMPSKQRGASMAEVQRQVTRHYQLFDKTCAECGTPFRGVGQRKYCSAPCRSRAVNAAYHARRAETRDAAPPANTNPPLHDWEAERDGGNSH